MSIPDAAVSRADGELHILQRAMLYHGDMHAIHFRVCPARRRGDACAKCEWLDRVAARAEDDYFAAAGGR